MYMSSAAKEQRGAAMVEAAIVFLLCAALIAFIIDIGIFLFEQSQLNDATNGLVRALGTDLGIAWHTGRVSQSPWDGSCDAYIRDAGKAYLAQRPGDFSMDTATAKYYFGSTVDTNKALIPSASAPYAILHIVGRMRPPAYLGPFLPAGFFTVDGSVLVEYFQDDCVDYG